MLLYDSCIYSIFLYQFIFIRFINIPIFGLVVILFITGNSDRPVTMNDIGKMNYLSIVCKVRISAKFA